MAKKKNFLPLKIFEIMSAQRKGKVLDLGCGDGSNGEKLLELGFEVKAFDMDRKRFKFHDKISFFEGNLQESLPYQDNDYDYVLFMEVIEHIYNPGFVISEISRVLKKNGKLILSTPNILNVSSRFRFLAEGSFDFFREPTLDFSKCFPAAIQNMHAIPWRYQELEYLLYNYGLDVESFCVDKRKMNFVFLAFLLRPIIFFQGKIKNYRSKKKSGVSFERINKILLSWDLLLGRHLILEAIKR